MRIYLFDTVVKHVILCGEEVCGSCLSFVDWACVEGVQSIMLQRMICNKQQFHKTLSMLSLGPSFTLGKPFSGRLLPSQGPHSRDSTFGLDRYPYLVLCSSKKLPPYLDTHNVGSVGTRVIKAGCSLQCT